MALSRREAFKFGFLLRCADEGLTQEQTVERIKMANAQLAELEKHASIWQAATSVPKLLLSLGPWGLLGGAGVGALGGIGLAKMTNKSVDPEEAKRQELIAAYQQQADRIRRSTAARRYRSPTAPRKPKLVA